jgi:O-acetyl-ADP-ribose deacetylase (regulator of RNase III)
MKIILSARDDELAEAWERQCGDVEGVEVKNGSILDLECDAIVSPANSYGFMDGGIDLLYSHHFGWGVQEELQQVIRARHHGELLVGQAEIVETGDAKIPFVIAAPTMRVPMILTDSINAYLAARAVFLLVLHGTFSEGARAGQAVRDHVKSVAFPGLGTGTGRMPAEICARQVRAAMDDVIVGKVPFPRTWNRAQENHQLLYDTHIRDLQEE